MKKLSVLSFVLSLLALVSVFVFLKQPDAGRTKEETGFERVMKTGAIRCGYILYPPNMARDPNSGELSGISYDIMVRMAQDLGVTLTWAEETSPASMVEGLQTNRYDLLCTNVWASAARGKVAQFSTPLYFTAINAYARKKDSRFSDQSTRFDDPALTIATIDGGIAAAIAREDDPQAKLYSLPEMTDFSNLLLAVKDHKADVTFSEEAQALAFEAHNPETLRNVTPDKPVRLFANAFMMKMGDAKMASMINNAILILQNNGFIDSVLSKHAPPGSYRRVRQGYQ